MPADTPGAQLSPPLVVGVVSDTHSHLYPRIAQLLEGVDHIIHAGDVGSAEVLRALRSIAPVIAVRGNCDLDGWAGALPARVEVELAGVRIVVAHMPRARRAGAPGRRWWSSPATATSHRSSNAARSSISIQDPRVLAASGAPGPWLNSRYGHRPPARPPALPGWRPASFRPTTGSYRVFAM